MREPTHTHTHTQREHAPGQGQAYPSETRGAAGWRTAVSANTTHWHTHTHTRTHTRTHVRAHAPASTSHSDDSSCFSHVTVPAVHVTHTCAATLPGLSR